MIKIKITNENREVAFRSFKLASSFVLRKYRQNLYYKKKKTKK